MINHVNKHIQTVGRENKSFWTQVYMNFFSNFTQKKPKFEVWERTLQTLYYKIIILHPQLIYNAIKFKFISKSDFLRKN